MWKVHIIGITRRNKKKSWVCSLGHSSKAKQSRTTFSPELRVGVKRRRRNGLNNKWKIEEEGDQFTATQHTHLFRVYGWAHVLFLQLFSYLRPTVDERLFVPSRHFFSCREDDSRKSFLFLRRMHGARTRNNTQFYFIFYFLKNTPRNWHLISQVATAGAEAEHKNILGTRERVLEKKALLLLLWPELLLPHCRLGRPWVPGGRHYQKMGREGRKKRRRNRSRNRPRARGGVYQEFVGSGSRLVLEGWVGWVTGAHSDFFFFFARPSSANCYLTRMEVSLRSLVQ